MIKRRFYKQDHGGCSDSSSEDSSSESDSSREDEHEGDRSEDAFEEDGEDESLGHINKSDKNAEHLILSGSGYESEDSSENEIKEDSSDLLLNEEEESIARDEHAKDSHVSTEVRNGATDSALDAGLQSLDPGDPLHAEINNHVLRCKSVFKCKLCPRIICLSEKTLKEHLNSKRHARSKKLLEEGRLKLMLNSDGELEEEQETHAERHARTLALAQELKSTKKKVEPNQRQQSEESESTKKKVKANQRRQRKKARKSSDTVDSPRKEKG